MKSGVWALYGGVMSKTPPSLKWLVDKRARLVKRIGKVKQEAEQARGMANSLDRACEALHHDLEALDRVLSLHEIRVHPETNRPLRTNAAGALFPYNYVTRSILSCLRRANGKWCSTTEIVLFVGSGGKAAGEVRYADLRLSVRKRLQALCAAGRIARRHTASTNVEGYWANLAEAGPLGS